jgi:ABC-type Mn2+/Zn2+ transport system ATPase subunit
VPTAIIAVPKFSTGVELTVSITSWASPGRRRTLGLAPVVVEGLYRSLHSLFEGGATLVLVEQDLNRALGVASRVVCMLEGRIVLDGRAGELTRDQIIEAYFGLRRGSGRDDKGQSQP